MYCATLRFEQQIPRVAVILILNPGVFKGLTGKMIFQLHSQHWQTIDKNGHINRKYSVGGRIMELTYYGKII